MSGGIGMRGSPAAQTGDNNTPLLKTSKVILTTVVVCKRESMWSQPRARGAEVPHEDGFHS